MKKIVLFDMDGVLYDSMPNHAVAWVRAMESYNIMFTAADSYATEGARGVETIQHFVKEQQGRCISEAEAQTMYDEKARIFATLPTPPVMPGPKEVMERFRSMGLAIGVVTGSAQRPLIARLLSDFGQYVAPQHVVTAYDVKRGKPAPDPYLMGMEKMSDVLGRAALPCETIVVENAPLGVRAAHAAGALTIAVNTGPLPDDALLSQGADLLFHTMKELADAAGNLGKESF